MGDQVVLREVVIGDWPAVHTWSSRIEVCRYQPWGPDTPEETRAYVEGVLRAAAQQPRTEYTLGVELRETGRLVGAASLFVRSEPFRAGEVGYFLHPDYWGHGLGTEIARLLLQAGFGRFGLHRIAATCDPRNVASARVLRKVGMVREGRLRHAMLIRDGWRDSDLYAILEHEWSSGDRRG